MLQIDFELARRVFGDRGVSRYALGGTGGRDLIDKAAKIIDILQVVHLGGVIALAGGRIQRYLWMTAGVERRVEQVKLQLNGNHRTQAAGTKALNDPLKHFAWIGCERLAVHVLYRQQDLQCRAL